MVHSYLKKSAMLLSLAAAVMVAEEVRADQAVDSQAATGQEATSVTVAQESPASPEALLQVSETPVQEQSPEVTVLAEPVQEEAVEPPVEG